MTFSSSTFLGYPLSSTTSDLLNKVNKEYILIVTHFWFPFA